MGMHVLRLWETSSEIDTRTDIFDKFYGSRAFFPAPQRSIGLTHCKEDMGRTSFSRRAKLLGLQYGFFFASTFQMVSSWDWEAGQRRGVAKLKVVEASFKLESVGRRLMVLTVGFNCADWWVLTVLMGEREGP